MNKHVGSFLASLLVILLAAGLVLAQTTGKIAGKVIDVETGDPLPGANVVIEGTSMGAAASVDGDYYIINLPPGDYTLRCDYIGYQSVKLENQRVSINRTSHVDFKLSSTVIEGQVVVVQAEKVAIKKDQTSSVRNVSSEQMDILPIESVGQVVNLQAGVVNGTFRGGRSGEVTYLVDGMQVTEAFGGRNRAVNVEADAVQEVEVIKGTFNAEYGRAMSGVVNAVTKDGGSSFHGSASASLANYLTENKNVWFGVKDNQFDNNQDYKFLLSGPVFSNSITFFTNFRSQNNDSYLNGMRVFLPTDSSNFVPVESPWYSEKSGDSSIVPMNWNKSNTFTGKLTGKVTTDIKVALLYNYNWSEGQGYDHSRFYAPDGRSHYHNKTNFYAVTLNHMLIPSLFYEAKLSYIDNYSGNYLYENPTDGRYISDNTSTNAGSGFYTGGQEKNYSKTKLKDTNLKIDLVWQLHKNHSLKTGIDYIHHDVDQLDATIRNLYDNTSRETSDYEPVIQPDSSIYSDIYSQKPIEFAAYMQDKMEFDEMTINLGLRYDYFDPNNYYPSNRRNPVNLISSTDASRLSQELKADPKTQLSPRLGLSYQLGDAALLRFSYGHFFQAPPFVNFYRNNSWLISTTNFDTQQGNAQLKAERTVQYELGLWQQLAEGMGLEIAVYYRDIYDLLSVAVVRTYNQQIYGLYTNKDYGNVKGLELTYDFELGRIFANLNYTLQFTRGNADTPLTNFNRAGDSADPIPRLIPMQRDQTHTLNASVAYRTRVWGLSATGFYNSNDRYTWAPLSESRLSRVNLFPNNAAKPGRYSVDLYSFYNLRVSGGLQLKLEMYVYNLLDRLNENGVYGRTGRAWTNIIIDSERNNFHSDFATIEQLNQNPGMYSAPRTVKLGLGVEF
ncbi:hypothetical protein A2V82_14720 [candidate division KSB1 bacterium RBG_16_48_16]|nr:MAG: hypothetical protein A2V82_14720 [candidate division KSB1 bacterium RBG_16_48_16]